MLRYYSSDKEGHDSNCFSSYLCGPSLLIARKSHLLLLAITIALTLPSSTSFTVHKISYNWNSYKRQRPNYNILMNRLSSPSSKVQDQEEYINQKDTDKNMNNWKKIQDKHDIKHVNSSTLWSESAMEKSLELYNKFTNCEDDYLVTQLKEAMHCLEGAYRLYGSNLVMGSFNGGKDAVVILHLLRAVHAKYESKQIKRQNVRPKVIYFENESEFPQIRSFVEKTVYEYDIDMIAFDPAFSFVDGLRLIVDDKQDDQLAFVLGTRQDDPNAGSQGTFAPSSAWMPPFMRVNPIIDWTYGQVWHFLRHFNLPYSDLYDNGYTSLGNVHDTIPNPVLLKPSGESYLPAYMLTDWSQERAGRLSKTKQPKATTKSISAASSAVSSCVPENQTNIVSTTPSSIVTDVVLNRPLSNNTNVPTTIFSCSSTLASLEEDSKQNANTALDPPISFEVPVAPPPTKANTSTSKQTVGLLIIGNEIIKGQTSDCNTYAAALALRSSPHLILKRVVIVADDCETIVSEIKSFLDTVDIIITSGGIGPTHDDITIESVSLALGQPLKLHPEMMKILQSKLSSCAAEEKTNTIKETNTTLSQAQMKMATLPESCELRFAGEKWPILQCQNIFILPGVPQFFQQKISSIASFLTSSNSVHTPSDTGDNNSALFSDNNGTERSCFCRYKVLLTVEEHLIVAPLNQVVQQHPNVTFGSYPFYNNEEWKTIVTLESNPESAFSKEDSSSSSSTSSLMKNVIQFTEEEMEIHLKLALAEFLMVIPDGSVLRVENDDNLIIS